MIHASTIKRTTVTSHIPKTKVEPAVQKSSKSNGDLQQKIAVKAYELFLKRNGGPGNADQDWLDAERLVKGL